MATRPDLVVETKTKFGTARFDLLCGLIHRRQLSVHDARLLLQIADLKVFDRDGTELA